MPARSRRKIVAPEATPHHRVTVYNMIEDCTPEQAKQNAIEARQRFLEHKSNLRSQFVTLAEQVAESTHFVRNFKFPESIRVYPFDVDVDQRFVSKCFPLAKGGMLLVDEPVSEVQKAKAYEKQKILKSLGYRHLVIEETMTLGDCLEQIGAL